MNSKREELSMRRPRLLAVAATLLVTAAVTAAGSSASGKPVSAADFAQQKFDRSTVIDNAWFPLQPGTQLIFSGSSLEGEKRLSHRVIFTVTDLTKVVGGVRNVVVWERDYSDGTLVERELALFAQDNDGNVWHLGEYPEEVENGKIALAPAWIAGIKGAKPGIAMKAAPKLGAPDYSQGLGPAVGWIDRAEAFQMGQHTCVPFRCFDNVLVTREFERNKPDASQLKYYAKGIGNVRVGWFGSKDHSKEVLVLNQVRLLDTKAMAAARSEALKLERSAYRISKDVYAQTPPSMRD
jgi:hypothetical protein